MHTRPQSANPFEDGSAMQGLRGLPSFEEARARLLHTAEHGRPFGVVRGQRACGTSEVLGAVADELAVSGSEWGWVDNRRTSPNELAVKVADALGFGGADPSSWRSLEDTLLGRASAQRTTVLLIDHLSDAGPSVMGDVRRLLAICEASSGWCTVLAAAELNTADVDRLVRDYGELRIEVGPFTPKETAEFLRRVVETTGCCGFTEDAVMTVHRLTHGVLYGITSICRLALLAQEAEGTPQVTAEMVDMVRREALLPSITTLSRDSLATLADRLDDPVTSLR